MKSVIFILFSIATAFTLSAQEKPIEKLSGMAGNWEVLTYEKGESGEWIEGTPSNATISFVLGGQFLQEEVIYRGKNMTMNAIINLGHDSRLNLYKATVMDQEYGVMDTYLGKFEEANTLIMTNLKDAYLLAEGGEKWGFKLTWVFLEEDEMTLNVQFTKDLGVSWSDFNKVIYTRLK